MREMLADPAELVTAADNELQTRRLPTLVLDRETIRNLTPTGFGVEAIGKKKTKSWPECGDTTTAKPTCPIEQPPGTPEPA